MDQLKKIDDEINGALKHPAASFWLKKALRESQNRDPSDAAYDADMLADLLKRRLDAVLGRAA